LRRVARAATLGDVEIIWVFVVTGLGVGLAGSAVLRAVGAPAPAGLCEGLSVLLWAAVGWWWAAGGVPSWWLPVPLVVTAFGVPLLLADLRHLRLPDVLTLGACPLFGAAVGVAVAYEGTGLAVRAATGALVFGGAHLAVHRLRPDSLGAGDVKLSGGLGLVLGAAGWAALALCAFLAAVVTLLVGLCARRRERGWGRAVPHGPGLLVATWLIVLTPVEAVARP
jgi:leader peptidase (prepilin peptidase)/N-methyltransferase